MLSLLKTMVNYMKNGLDMVMGCNGPKESEADETFLHQGKDIIVTLESVYVIQGLVKKFSEEVGELAWHEFADLADEEKAAILAMVPDNWKGQPEAKLVNRYMLNFVYEPTDRHFFHEGIDKTTGKPWTRSDIVFYTDVQEKTDDDGVVTFDVDGAKSNVPKGPFRKLLEAVGPEIGESYNLSDYLHPGDEFLVTLMLKEDGYLHLNPKTLSSVNIGE
jgi:hypothetical protein